MGSGWFDEPVYSILAFVAMWIAIGFFLAVIGGWRSLAEAYTAGADRFQGKRWPMQSGAMRWTTRYNNMLTIGADPGGLYLSVLFLFRAGHPPLYIPWENIDISERRGWLFTYVVFAFKGQPGVCLTVSRKLGERVVEEGRRQIAPDPARSFWRT